jgi:hypothetical protein
MAGTISGVIVAAWGYPALTLLAALATAPLIVLASLATSRIAHCTVAAEAVDRQRSDTIS